MHWWKESGSETKYIRSNLQVAQNGRFVINLVHPGHGNMVATILDYNFGLWKSEKCTLQDLLLFQIIPIGSWILREFSWISTWHSSMNFSNSLFNFTTFFMVWKLQTALIIKLVPGCFFAWAETISAFVDLELQLMMVPRAMQAPYFATSSPDFHIEFVKSVIDLNNS